jgi:molybdenum cofactor guanylyltransferase
MSLPTAALILAGGASSRMGQDKALLLWQGVPMLQRVINAAAQCCPEIYLLTSRTEIYRTHLKSQIKNQIKNQTRYHWLPEIMPPQGPLVALSQGLGKIPAEWVLVLACDLPLLDGKILHQWRSQLPHLSPSILALVPHHEYWHPLCGFYRPQALPSLEKFLSQGGKSFQAWLPSLPAQKIPLGTAEIAMLWNCNSPADLNLQQ